MNALPSLDGQRGVKSTRTVLEAFYQVTENDRVAGFCAMACIRNCVHLMSERGSSLHSSSGTRDDAVLSAHVPRRIRGIYVVGVRATQDTKYSLAGYGDILTAQSSLLPEKMGARLFVFVDSFLARVSDYSADSAMPIA